MTELPRNMSLLEQAQEAVSYLSQRLPTPLQRPRVAIVCGSGLGGLADTIHDMPKAEFDYSSIPHFPQLTGKPTRKKSLSGPVILTFRSYWTCWKAGFWVNFSKDPGRFNGWPRTVSLFSYSLII